jgi:hypothetical protein
VAVTVYAANAVMTAPKHPSASRLKRRRHCLLLRLLFRLLLSLRLNRWWPSPLLL